MKLTALTVMTAVAMIAGAAVAQGSAPVTMQPIPNPPEGAAKHHMMAKHHAMAKHHKMAAKADAGASMPK
jgi:hypothetical protein